MRLVAVAASRDDSPEGGERVEDVAANAWLIEDLRSPAEVRSAVAQGAGAAGVSAPWLALRIHDLVVHNNKKWFDFFGGASVRVDVVVVQGNILDDEPASFFTPSTTRFSDVAKGDKLAIDEHGLLAYYGRPKHFLDLSIMISRDRKNSDDLSRLISTSSNTDEFKSAASALGALTAAAPHVALVTSAVAGAATIANLAYRLVSAASGNTIGIYHGNRLAFPDHFGVGRNPEDGTSYRKNDMSFWFEVVDAEPKGD